MPNPLLGRPIPNAAYPTGGQGLTLGLDGKVPVSVLPRVVTGRVSLAGAVVAGTGWTAAHPGTGHWTVTFTVAFPAPPTLALTAGSTGRIISYDPAALAAGGFGAFMTTDAGVLDDQEWQFIAWTTA